MSKSRIVEKNYKYKVTIPGFTRGKFSKVSGLKKSVERIDYRESDEPDISPQLPGRSSVDDVTLERGYLKGNDDFVKHLKLIHDSNDATGAPEKIYFNVTIELLNKAGTPVFKWKLINCWVGDVEWDDLDANANDIMLERIVLVVEDLDPTKL